MIEHTKQGLDLVKRVLGKTDASEEEIKRVLLLDMSISIGQMTISANETRQVRQYESNNYFISVQYDLSEAFRQVIDEVLRTPADQQEAKYFESKKVLWQMVADRYKNTENYLRELIKQQQEEDGIKR